MLEQTQIEEVKAAIGKELFEDIRSCIIRIFDTKELIDGDAKDAIIKVNEATLGSLVGRIERRTNDFNPENILNIISADIKSENQDKCPALGQ